MPVTNRILRLFVGEEVVGSLNIIFLPTNVKCVSQGIAPVTIRRIDPSIMPPQHETEQDRHSNNELSN